MKIGVLFLFYEPTVRPGPMAKEMERLGFESLWVPEHPVLPVNPQTPFPQGGPIPGAVLSYERPVRMSLDGRSQHPASEARHRNYARAGHNPIVHATQVATLDFFSGGRVIYGIGAGWLREESELLGVDFPRRWTQTGEYVAAMRELWTKPEASFEGKYVKFPTVRCYPKPIQQPGPPVLLGSKDRNALKRVARWGDGWCPQSN